MMKFERIDYNELSGKQQEIYNFQKVAGVLADYGFNCIKLDDDWRGADFLAYHKDGVETLKVQLKGRITIDKKYIGKDLYVAFPVASHRCLIEHDELLRIISQVTSWLETSSWTLKGQYHSGKPSRTLVAALEPYTLTDRYKQNRTIGQLFEVEPLQWGLRGDPFLWKEMRAHFLSVSLPSTASELDVRIAQAFELLTGHPITEASEFYVNKYAHGGMSSGMISPEFWRNEALSLLRSRYVET